jgi:hypothetical protein
MQFSFRLVLYDLFDSNDEEIFQNNAAIVMSPTIVYQLTKYLWLPCYIPILPIDQEQNKVIKYSCCVVFLIDFQRVALRWIQF